MPITEVIRAITIADRAFAFRAVVWECADCGRKDAFSDMLDENRNRESEFEPQRAGWQVQWGPGFNGDDCKCHACAESAQRNEPK